MSPGDVVEAGESIARIARADGSTIEQRATDRMRGIECLIPTGGLMESKSRMLVLGPVTPDRDSPRPATSARAGCAAPALVASVGTLGALLLLVS